MVTVTVFWRYSTTTIITIRSRLSKVFSGALTSASCVSRGTITRDNIDARGTKGNKAAYRAYRSPDVLCPHCQRHFYGTACLERHPIRTIDGRPHDQDHRPVKRDGNARSVALTCVGPKPSKIIVAGTRIATPVNNTWTLNPINVSFRCGHWTTPCNRPFTCSLTLKPNKSTADTCPTSWSVSAPTTTSSIGGTVTRASKSFCSN